MYSEEQFQARLNQVFGGRLRLRWSNRKGEFHVEEKVGRAVLPPIHMDDTRDDHIRARDGYAFVMAVRPGDRMPCPTCGDILRVPVMYSGVTQCPRCTRLKGRDIYHNAAYFPLGENLIDHLKSIDPLGDHLRNRLKDIDKNNTALDATKERDFHNYSEGVIKDYFWSSVNFPKVGYTGKEKYQ